MDAERCEPAGPWHACAGWRAPPTRPDQGPPWRAIDALARPHAQPGVYASLHEEREMRLGAQAPSPHPYIPRPSARLDRGPLGQVGREEGRHHQLQEQAWAGRKPPQEARPGNATPRPLDRWLTTCRL